MNIRASSSPIISKIVKSIVFCPNSSCILFCHIDNYSCLGDICSICGHELVSFCKSCDLFPVSNCHEVQHVYDKTSQKSVHEKHERMNQNSLLKYHDPRKSFQVMNLSSTIRRTCQHLRDCPHHDNVSLESQISSLLNGIHILKFELSCHNEKKSVDGSLQYKIHLLSKREQELVKIQKKVQVERHVKQTFRQSISSNDMNRIAQVHFDNKNVLDKSMCTYLELSVKKKLKKDWISNPIKIDSVYPKEAPFDESTSALLHVSNCSRILYPDQIGVGIQTHGILLKAQVISITKHSIRCIFPKVSQPMQGQVVLEDYCRLGVNNTNIITFTYTAVDRTLPRVKDQKLDIISNPLNQNLCFEAIWRKDLDFVKDLVANDPRKYLIERDNFERTILHLACAVDNCKIVSFLFAVYGRYFDHLKLGDHYSIFKMMDINGCNIYNIADSYRSAKVMKFLKQYLPDDRAVRSELEPSVFNLITDYFPQIPYSSTNYHCCKSFTIPTSHGEESVTMILEEQNSIKSIMNGQQYEVCLLRKQDHGNRKVIPGEDMFNLKDAEDRFNYFSVILMCIQYHIIPRASHILFVKKNLETDHTQSINELVGLLSIHSHEFDLAEPALPQLGSILTILCQLLSCNSLDDISSYLV